MVGKIFFNEKFNLRYNAFTQPLKSTLRSNKKNILKLGNDAFRGDLNYFLLIILIFQVLNIFNIYKLPLTLKCI